jgi:hypothetical protein
LNNIIFFNATGAAAALLLVSKQTSTALVITATLVTLPRASLTNNDRWLTTLTGRLGYAWNRLLVYGKGGGAWVGSTP